MSQFDSPTQPGQPQPSPDLGAAFRWAWKKFQENAATLIVSFLIILIICVVVGAVLALIAGGILFAGGGTHSTIASFFFTVVVIFPTTAVAYLLFSGYVRSLLSIAEGGKPEIGDTLKPYDPPKTIVYAFIVAGISAVLSAVGGLIPVLGPLLSNGLSIVVGFLFSFGIYFLVERGLEPIEALKTSVELATNNLGPAIVFYLCAGIAAALGLIACCIGIIVSAPVGALVFTYGYRGLTGRGVAA